MLKWSVTVAVGLGLLSPFLLKLTPISSLSSQWSFLSFCSGVLTAFSLLSVPRLVKGIASHSSESEGDSRIYGLHHGVLNLQVPPTTWWMNMGYWKDQMPPTNLPHACEALLRKVMSQAGLLNATQVAILDVGFGCGDQTHIIPYLCNILSYVGVTLDAKQYRFAKSRFLRSLSSVETRSIHLYQANAAQPDLWSADMKQTIVSAFNRKSWLTGEPSVNKWLLALDTLYHFKPSRQPLFQYGFEELHCSVAAFDLFRSDSTPSLVQSFILRLTCGLFGTPLSNFLTIQEYRQLLSSVGYHQKDIQITDISEDVFAPLVEFLDHQDQHLQTMGLGIGRFRVAKWLFSWWARTGIVRGCVVTAKYPA